MKLKQTALIFVLSSVLLSACDRQEPTPDTENAAAPEVQMSEPADTSPQTQIEETQNTSTDDDTSSSPSDDGQQTNKDSIVKNTLFAEAQDRQGKPINGDGTGVKDSDHTYCLNLEESLTKAETIEKACKSISDRLASVSMQSCVSAQLKETQCYSVNQFPLLFTEFAPLKDVKPKGRVLLIGGTHGDELTSVSIIFKWIETLNRHHSGLFHWHVVPLVNPDGLLKKSATRTNQNGVDINRNLPSNDWQANALEYWRTKSQQDPRKFPGNKAASEPESQWLIDEIEQFKPDVIVSVHAPYGVVDFDSHILNRAPRSLGRLHLNLLGTYPGSLGNYAGINRSIPVITLELAHSWIMPNASETTKIWEDLVYWLKHNIDSKSIILSANDDQ